MGVKPVNLFTNLTEPGVEAVFLEFVTSRTRLESVLDEFLVMFELPVGETNSTLPSECSMMWIRVSPNPL